MYMARKETPAQDRGRDGLEEKMNKVKFKASLLYVPPAAKSE